MRRKVMTTVTKIRRTPGNRPRHGRATKRRRVGPTTEAMGVYRDNGISYLDVPSRDPRESAIFFHSVFGWTVEERPGAWSFQDGSGHVIGHFVRDRAPSEGDGVLPYIFVPSVDRSLARVLASKGKVVRAPFPMGELWIATFRDPSSNIVGIWQRGPR